MAFTQGDLDAINEALTAGELEATFPDGSKIRYRSVSELIRVKTMIKKELSAAQGKRRVTGFRVNVSKGA